jgi:hypothetical protein
MGEVRTEFDVEHPCLACGSPWLVHVESRTVEDKFIVWRRCGVGDCSAECMTRDAEAYSRGLMERIDRGWGLMAQDRHELRMPSAERSRTRPS